MAQDFSAAVDRWVLQTRQRMDAVFRLSAQFTVEDIIDNTPVDTGYLRNSLTVTTDGPLPMRGSQGDGYAAAPYALVIAGADVNDTIFASFVANYAAHVEYGARGRAGRAMVRKAAQNWPANVARATAAAKARVGPR